MYSFACVFHVSWILRLVGWVGWINMIGRINRINELISKGIKEKENYILNY